ncbi:MAG: QueT transporter family protein [Lachnospiraceae bacterium]|nr:QueT transporter family protein [Lachnospiraceae bacterium]
MNKNNKKVLRIAMAAMIAALYVTLTFIFAPISFGNLQVRVSECLTILPLFTPAAVPGLFIGCILGNMLGGAILPDIIAGSIATLLGAVGTRMLRKTHPVLATLPPVLTNMLIVPFVLRYGYGVTLPLWLMSITVGIGELISCTVLGMILYRVFNRRKEILATC